MSAPPLRAELGVDLATQVAHVGLTVAEATACRPNARVAHLPLSHVDRAIAVGATDGFVTLVAAPRRGTRHLAGGRLVGATVVAPTGGELIHEAALAMQTKMTVAKNLLRIGWREPKRHGLVLLSRILFGMNSLLASLEAEADWRSMLLEHC